MKRTALLPIGIAAATILVVMALWILLTGTFYLFPVITIDPVGADAVDEYGILILTGTTNLGLNTYFFVNVSPASGTDGPHETEIASVDFGSRGRNSWRAVINTSALPPGEYSIRVSTVTYPGNGKTAVPGDVAAKAGVTIPERQVPDPAAKKHFFRINTVGSRAAGERVDVTGTTDLLPETPVHWKMEPVPCLQNNTSSKEPSPGTRPVAEGRTSVTPGVAGIHRWSFAIDSPGMPPGCYHIDVSGDSVEATADIALSGDSAGIGPVPSGFITIDTFPDPLLNTLVVLTGTTSLSAGEEIFVEITPDMGDGFDFLVNPQDRSQGASFSGVIETVAVEAGNGGLNLWSMGFDTYRLRTGKYRVEVSNSKVNTTTFQLEEGNVSAAQIFFIRGETP